MLLYEKKIITLSHIHTEKERDENLCSHPLLHSPNVCNDQDLTISSLLEEAEAAQSEWKIGASAGVKPRNGAIIFRHFKQWEKYLLSVEVFNKNKLINYV